jgi:dihydroxyacetone kinase
LIISFGNYAGDVMNFGLARDQLIAEGIPTELVIVTDDIASAPPQEQAKRRGVAGDFTVFKVMAAAAEEGLDLAAVVAAGERANAATRSLGVAFDGCTLPGAAEPLFTVPEGRMGLGLGIHGEPGVKEVDVVSARELAELLVEQLLAERGTGLSSRVAVILNGLGRTKYEELFCVYGRVAELLDQAGLTVVEPEVGELVTSLDMAGCSLTLMDLDPDLERWWRAPALSPAYTKGNAQLAGTGGETAAEPMTEPDPGRQRAAVNAVRVGSAAGQVVGRSALAGLSAWARAVEANAERLGKIDAIAGDGDHGRGMVKGAQHAEKAAQTAVNAGGDAPAVLKAAGQAWAAGAGGTSGVLWGAGLEAFGRALPPDQPPSAEDLLAGANAFLDAIKTLGKAQLGDKTMIDALEPFVKALGQEVAQNGSGSTVAADRWQWWLSAAAVAEQAAQATAELVPKVGRARPLAERSLGTPDAGAVSMALILEAVGQTYASGN